MPLYLYYYYSSEIEELYKFRYAFKNLLIWTLLPVALGVVGWCYLFAKGMITISATPQVVIALSNA